MGQGGKEEIGNCCVIFHLFIMPILMSPLKAGTEQQGLRKSLQSALQAQLEQSNEVQHRPQYSAPTEALHLSDTTAS